MSVTGTPETSPREIDVRTIAPPQRHRLVFDAYTQLSTGESLVVVNDHEPLGLRQEFEREFAGAYGWESLGQVDQEFRVQITKLASTALPRVVAETTDLLAAAGASTGGSIWQLEPGARDLDSNIIALPAGDEIGLHIGPDLDVLVLVLQGSGQLHTELDVVELQQGTLVWLPRNAQRRFVAGSEGIQYLTVHHRKPTLNITAKPTGQ